MIWPSYIESGSKVTEIILGGVKAGRAALQVGATIKIVLIVNAQ